MCDCEFDSAYQYPDDVTQGAHHAKIAGGNISAEGPEYETGDLQALQTERNPYDGDTKDQSYNCPYERDNNAAEKQPE